METELLLKDELIKKLASRLEFHESIHRRDVDNFKSKIDELELKLTKLLKSSSTGVLNLAIKLEEIFKNIK
jgi:hypothetical protein